MLNVMVFVIQEYFKIVIVNSVMKSHFKYLTSNSRLVIFMKQS